VTFQSDRDGDLGIFRQPANGSREAERLTTADPNTTHVPDAWSPDGKTLLFEETRSSYNVLKALSTTDRTTSAVADIGGTYPIDATFSPNGRFIAYRTPGSRSIVAVQPFPPTGPKIPISDGVYPAWLSNGKSLIFRRLTTGEFFVSDVTTAADFTFTTPRQLPKSFLDRMSNAGRRNYDVLPDGRMLGVVLTGDTHATAVAPQIQVVLNWQEELKQRVVAK